MQQERKTIMKKITAENLAEFAPQTGSYETRLNDFIDDVGLESMSQRKSYGAALRRVNRESGIGFTKEEIQILDLIYTMDERNERFDNDTHIQPGHGGNTAEHPIFMSLAFDSFKDKAGLGGTAFDPKSEESLRVARLSQQVHGMIAVHDVGEIIDISFGEQLKAGATYKEPEEEKLVGPFKFKLAAYALSVGMPEIYADTIHDIKETATKAKKELFEQAVRGEIAGDDFVAGVGKVIGAKIAEAENKMQAFTPAMEYADAAEKLSDLFHEAETGTSVAAKLLGLTDQFEGSFHYAHFAGKGVRDFAEKVARKNPELSEQAPEQAFRIQHFGDGQSADYALAKSSAIEGQITYPQKSMMGAFKAVEQASEDTKDIADKLVRAAVGSIFRNMIEVLRKSPPLVDFSDNQKKEPGILPTAVATEQDAAFATRLEVQRELLKKSLSTTSFKDREVTTLEGVMDTKAVIAVVEKAIRRIESGEWRPDTSSGAKHVLPVRGELPEAIHVNRKEIVESSKRNPLAVASAYRDAKFSGEKITLRSAGGKGR